MHSIVRSGTVNRTTPAGQGMSDPSGILTFATVHPRIFAPARPANRRAAASSHESRTIVPA